MNETELQLREIIDKETPKSIKINGTRYYISKKIINEIKEREKEGKSAEHSGGILPLIPILAGIFGATAAAAGTAAGVAKTVSDSREAQKKSVEIEKAKEELRQLKLKDSRQNVVNGEPNKVVGEGLYLDPYQGKGIGKFFKEQIKQNDSLTNDEKDVFYKVLKSFKGGCKCSVNDDKNDGSGLYLDPF